MKKIVRMKPRGRRARTRRVDEGVGSVCRVVLQPFGEFADAVDEADLAGDLTDPVAALLDARGDVRTVFGEEVDLGLQFVDVQRADPDADGGHGEEHDDDRERAGQHPASSDTSGLSRTAATIDAIAQPSTPSGRTTTLRTTQHEQDDGGVATSTRHGTDREAGGSAVGGTDGDRTTCRSGVGHRRYCTAL